MSVARSVIGIVLSVFLGFCDGTANKGTIQDRTRLYADLSAEYQKNLNPDGIGGGPVVVNHSISIQRIVSLDDNVLVLGVWIFMGWNDPRLQWSPEEYNGVTQISVPSSSIWQPDIMLLNNAADYTGTSSGDLNVVIFNDGYVSLVPPTFTRSFCSVDNGDLYNHNQVNCTLKFSSWTFNSRSLDLELVHEGVDLGNFNRKYNKQWECVSSTATRLESTYDCCPGDMYPKLEYKLTLKRVG